MRRPASLALLGLVLVAAAPVAPADARTVNGCTIRPGTVCVSADLRGVALRGATLRNATLRASDLRRADLRRADLRNADLRKADLRGADLRSADLRGARLAGTRLAGARLQGAKLAGTILAPGTATQAASGAPGSAGSTAGAGGGTGASALPDPTSLILPYADASGLERIGPKVSLPYAQANPGSTPPFVFHNGIDFVANRDLVPFRSMTHATVSAVEVMANGPNEQVSIRVDAGGGFTIVYGFEPMAPGTGQQQLAQIDVRVGDRLQPGSPIGRLVRVGAAAHLHVHMQPSTGNDAICFPERWSASDRAAATALLTGGYSQLCYG